MLSTMRTPEVAEALSGAPLFPRAKPWKKARHVGSTESGLSSQRAYICSMTSELARGAMVMGFMTAKDIGRTQGRKSRTRRRLAREKALVETRPGERF